jgi:hypothetical protein
LPEDLFSFITTTITAIIVVITIIIIISSKLRHKLPAPLQR